jgi:DNA-binding transcriptional regulator YiaG
MERPPGLMPAEVRQLRRTLDMTQAELAAELLVSVTTVARWETGLRRVGPLATRALFHLAQQVGAARRKTE